jgi:hypothetical protein
MSTSKAAAAPLVRESFEDKVKRLAAALRAVIGDDIGYPHATLALDYVMKDHLRMATHLEMAGVKRSGPEISKWH